MNKKAYLTLLVVTIFALLSGIFYLYQNPELPGECTSQGQRISRLSMANANLERDGLAFFSIDTNSEAFLFLELQKSDNKASTEYKACIIQSSGFSLKLIDYQSIKLSSAVQAPVISDINKDELEDVRLFYASNYQVQDMYLLWLKSPSGYTFIEGFENLPASAYDNQRLIFTSDTVTAPAKAGYIHTEFTIDDDYRIKYSRLVTRNVLPTSSADNFEFSYSLSTEFDENNKPLSFKTFESAEVLQPDQVLSRFELL